MNTQKKKSVFDMLGGHSQGAAAPEIARKIPLSDIRPDPNQPRKHFNQADLEDMAESMREVGVIQPITVKPSGTIPPWDIVAGERRWRSAALAGLGEIPAYIRDDLSDGGKRIRLVQLIENANRQDLTDLETARSIKALLDEEAKETGKSHGGKSRIARLINRSPQVVGRYLAMLESPAIEWCEEGLVTSADVVQFLRGAPDEVRDQLLQQARETGEVITQSQVREAVKSASRPPEATSAGASTATGSEDHAGATEPVAAAGDALGTHGADNEQRDAHSVANGDAGSTAAVGDSTAAAADDGDHDPDHDEDDQGDAGDDASGHSSAGQEHRATDRSAGGTREKGISLNLTGEKVEDLLRYLVDKSSDRLEVRLSADLGRAVIENLGGEVPERPETYGSLILDLLANR